MADWDSFETHPTYLDPFSYDIAQQNPYVSSPDQGADYFKMATTMLPYLMAAFSGPQALIGPAIATLAPIAMDMMRPGAPAAENAASEYQWNLHQFKTDAARRALGAKQLSGLAGLTTPEDIKTSAELSALGLMGNPEQEAQHISQRHKWTSGHPELVQSFLDKAPQLKEENWQGYLDLMDAAAQRNLNMTPENYVPATKPEDMGTALNSMGVYSIWEAPKYEAPKNAFNPMDLNAAIASAETFFGMPQAANQNAGGSLADVALGYAKGGGPGTLSEDQLTQYGFTPGHYQKAMQEYLLGLDPSLKDNEKFNAIFGPTVAGPGLTDTAQASNEAQFQQQMDDWTKNLQTQKSLWEQQWEREVGARQQGWTSGHYTP